MGVERIAILKYGVDDYSVVLSGRYAVSGTVWVRVRLPSRELRAITLGPSLLEARGSWLVADVLMKPHIALKEQLNIIHAVFQDRNSLHAHAEGESRDFSAS